MNKNIKLYSKNAVICFEYTIWKEEILTVNLEMAHIENGIPSWGTKVSFQLTDFELTKTVACFLGYIPNIELKRQKKGVYIERQLNKFYFRCSSSENSLINMPINLEQGIKASSFLLNRLNASLGSTTDVTIACIRGSYKLYQYE